MKSIFISHATADASIASAIVDLIENGIGVPGEEIFCSSLEGYGIPTGENFISHIKDQIQAPDVVVLILTPNYFDSKFCLCEMGAAWAKSHRIFPILVPPLEYGDVKDVITATQVAKIDNDIKYNELRDYLTSKLSFQSKSSTKWDTERRRFLGSLPELLENMRLPKSVSPEEFQALKHQLEEAQATLSEYASEVNELKNLNKRLEKAKDASEVSEIKRSTRKTGIEEDFERLLNDIAEFRKVTKSSEVFKFILSDYYDKPYRPDLFHYGDEFSQAVRRNLINLEDSHSVKWDNSRVAGLRKKLDSLQSLVDGPDEKSLARYHEDAYELPLEADNEEFWEFHYLNS
ncbi:toll/interleukin-1 receptor domain-containing protein [Burkholderia ubonensis]|uniref:toll/interleukin-1 receptor domain-containing protein n=1 Tax=Burkholderia ubonensis TaxID=101571 RepID=UPI000AE384CB|nr:toll/interleukin-1 receptor domain-containing protein [Burkholderia ubonensis]